MFKTFTSSIKRERERERERGREREGEREREKDQKGNQFWGEIKALLLSNLINHRAREIGKEEREKEREGEGGSRM